eukprot:jgi/Psemu1/183667/e_gw1.33.39.1
MSSIPRDPSPSQSPSSPSSSKKKKKKKKDRPSKEQKKNKPRTSDPHITDISPDSNNSNNSNNSSNFNLLLTANTRLLSYDFVLRSLRRRLWKAFSEDDSVEALKTYQATLADLVQWLEEEEEEKLRRQREKEARRQSKSSPAAAATGTAAVEMVHSRSFEQESSSSLSLSNLFSSSSHHRTGTGIDINIDTTLADSRSRSHSPTSSRKNKPDKEIRRRRIKKSIATTDGSGDHGNSQDDNREYRNVLLRLHQEQKMETESMIGGSNIPILQCKMNPSDAFIADDYLSPYDDSTYDHPAQTKLPDPIKHALEQQAIIEERKRRKRKSRHPRTAFRKIFLGRQAAATSTLENVATIDPDDIADTLRHSSTTSFDFVAENNKENNYDDDDEEEDTLTTTPLHEAARLGAANLVRLLLANGGDVNAKNGFSRNAIHMCAGGITSEERELLASTTTPVIGIGATMIPNESLDLLRQIYLTLDTRTRTRTRSKRTLFGKLLSFSNKRDRDEKNSNNTILDNSQELKSVGSYRSPNGRRTKGKKTTGFDPKRLDRIVMDRMDVMLALLSWVDAGSGDGPSINAVDSHGRTSLHYAAEHGRSDVCMAILSNFGVMLTIVDELGTRTPCEVAAANGHDALAAQLEARALLYVDPYGMDDEMLGTLMAANETGSTSYVNKRNNPCGRLVPPFRWFITCSREEVAQERWSRLEEAREKLEKVIFEEQHQESPENKVNTSEELDQKQSADALAILKQNPMYSSVRGLEYLEPYVKPAPVQSATNTNEEKPEEHLKPAASPSNHDLKLDDTQINHHLEHYMAHHKWDISAAVCAFEKNRAEALTAAGVKYTLNETPKTDGRGEDTSKDVGEQTDARLCAICYDDEVAEEDWVVLGNCEHGFCRDCLTEYVKECGSNRRAIHSITCPQHGCEAGVSISDVRDLLEKDHPEILYRIEEASTDHFIATHPNFKFCTYPNCKGVVHRLKQPKWASAEYDETFLNYTGATCVACHDGENYAGSTSACNELTYEGVADPEYTNCRSRKQPLKAQRFCFSCGGAVHWPLTCQLLGEWNQRVSDEIGVVDNGNGGETNIDELAQKLWLKANTRPCPKCNVPIEKNDGCNHMVCHGCLHEFCWICRKDWKSHSNETGGYFRCNIWKEDDPDRVEDKNDGGSDFGPSISNNNNPYLLDVLNDQGYGTSVHSARKAWRKKQEMKRFIHHYTRWEAHKESAILEQKMGDSVCTRLAPVVQAAMEFNVSPSFNFGGKGLSFLHNAFFELAECRSTLRYSYGFSFFRYPLKSSSKSFESQPIGYVGNKRKEKLRFERLQSELETITEQMSDIVARSHLRATQMQITYLTAGAAEKRVELNNFLFQIFREEKRAIANPKNNEIKQMQSATTPNGNNRSSSQEHFGYSTETFSRLLQIRDRNYQPTLSSYVTTTSISPPTNDARSISLQLAASNEHVHAVGEAVQEMERLLSRARNAGHEMHDDYDGGSEYYPMASDPWGCPRCTFLNTGVTHCAMCAHRRE